MLAKLVKWVAPLAKVTLSPNLEGNDGLIYAGDRR